MVHKSYWTIQILRTMVGGSCMTPFHWCVGSAMVWPIRRLGTRGGWTRPVSMPMRIMIPCWTIWVGISMALLFRYLESITLESIQIQSLIQRAGGTVHILVIDTQVSGVYDTILIDIDRDGDFGDESPVNQSNPTYGRDTNGDGFGTKALDCCGGFQMVSMACLMAIFMLQEMDIKIELPVRVNWFCSCSMMHQKQAAIMGRCASAVSAQGVIRKRCRSWDGARC